MGDTCSCSFLRTYKNWQNQPKVSKYPIGRNEIFILSSSWYFSAECVYLEIHLSWLISGFRWYQYKIALSWCWYERPAAIHRSKNNLPGRKRWGTMSRSCAFYFLKTGAGVWGWAGIVTEASVNHVWFEEAEIPKQSS